MSKDDLRHVAETLRKFEHVGPRICERAADYLDAYLDTLSASEYGMGLNITPAASEEHAKAMAAEIDSLVEQRDEAWMVIGAFAVRVGKGIRQLAKEEAAHPSMSEEAKTVMFAKMILQQLEIDLAEISHSPRIHAAQQADSTR